MQNLSHFDKLRKYPKSLKMYRRSAEPTHNFRAMYLITLAHYRGHKMKAGILFIPKDINFIEVLLCIHYKEYRNQRSY